MFGDFFDWKGSTFWEKIKITFGLLIMVTYELFIKKWHDKYNLNKKGK